MMLPYKDFLPRNYMKSMKNTVSERVIGDEGVFGCMNEEN